MRKNEIFFRSSALFIVLDWLAQEFDYYDYYIFLCLFRFDERYLTYDFEECNNDNDNERQTVGVHVVCPDAFAIIH